MGPFVSSVAVRGFQYANLQEFPHKFLALRKPQLLETARTKENNMQLVRGVEREIYNSHIASTESMPPLHA